MNLPTNAEIPAFLRRRKLERKETQAEAYTVNQVSEILNMSTRTIKAHLYSGEIRGVKIGGHWRITRREISRLLSDSVAEAATDEP